MALRSQKSGPGQRNSVPIALGGEELTCSETAQAPGTAWVGGATSFGAVPPLQRARARRRLARAPPAGGGGCGWWRRARALSPPRAGSRSRAGTEEAVATAAAAEAAAEAAEAARGEGREGGGWGGMDRARRPQRQEPVLERERRRWRRRRLLLPSPPVSECPRLRRWRRPRPLNGPCGPGGESCEGSVAGRRRRRGPGLPLAAWGGWDPWSPPFGAEALGLGLDPQHPSGPLSSPGPFRCHFDPGVSLPSPSPRPLPSTPSRAAGREGRVRRWAEARRTVWKLALGGRGSYEPSLALASLEVGHWGLAVAT